MAQYIIQGGKKLQGKIRISGNKNSILACLAATLLTEEEVVLKNVPRITDVNTLLEILKSLGAGVGFDDNTITSKTAHIKSHSLPKELTDKLRASILLAGPLLAREGQVNFTHPGGDIIGKRTVDPHFSGLQALGYQISLGDREYRAKASGNMPTGVDYFFEESSCTATENIIMAAVLGKRETLLKNCAHEPQIVDLCSLLTQMGADIKGAGTSTITIKGVEKLHGTKFLVSPDYIEMATYAIAVAITSGKITIENCPLANLEPITINLGRFGVGFTEVKPNIIEVFAKELKAPASKLHTNIWPGFPTDLMSATIVLATQASGVSLLHDWMYESRMFFVDKLISMGANITIADPHRVVVYGKTKLFGRELETPDIRAGMALVLAALIAQGQSVIHRAQLIDRGYEDVAGNLTKLGAKISRQ